MHGNSFLGFISPGANDMLGYVNVSHFHPNPKLLRIIYFLPVNVRYIVLVLLMQTTLYISWLPFYPNLNPLHAISTHFPSHSLHYSSHTFTIVVAQTEPQQYFITHNYTSTYLPHDIVYPQCIYHHESEQQYSHLYPQTLGRQELPP